METLPEPQDPIKSFLFWLLMSDEDVARYSDLSNVLDTIKKGELCWQAAASVGVHALVLGVLGETDNQKALAESLAGYALEPMEALHEHLIQQAHEKALTDEQARTLFHVRFGLGFLLQAKGEREAAKRLLHEMAATKLSQHGGCWAYREGEDIVKYFEDMGRAKDLTASVMCDVYAEAEDYEEALFLITEAADSTGDRLQLLPRAGELLDGWAAKCPGTVETWDLPEFMFDLLESASRVLSVCQHWDTSGALPGECQQGSAQFLAYKLGQLAARFATKDVYLWHAVLSDFESPNAVYLLVESLLSDCDPQRDWQKAREAYVTGWELTPRYRGIPAEEIAPHTDLYWAMRIGFADKMLESTRAVVLSAEPVPTTPVVPNVQALMDVMSSIDRKLDQRLPRSSREVRERVMRHLIPVADLVSPKVLNVVTKAERLKETEVNDEDAMVWFAKAVEAALSHCFVEPLIEFMKRHGQQEIDLPFPPPRGRERKRAAELRKLKLWEWADVLDTLVTPARRGLSALGTQDLRRFMDQHVGPRWPNFAPLPQCLREVWKFRAGSAHYEQAEPRLEKEPWELEEMRKLVLGTPGSPSIIVQIYRLLAPSKQP